MPKNTKQRDLYHDRPRFNDYQLAFASVKRELLLGKLNEITKLVSSEDSDDLDLESLADLKDQILALGAQIMLLDEIFF